MIEGKHVQWGLVSQLIPVTGMETVLTDLYTHRVSRNATVPQYKGRYGVK